MSEKVLGFNPSKNKERARNKVWTGNYLVKPNNLVPVVSLEEHKAKIKILKETISNLMRNKSPAETFRNNIKERKEVKQK